MTLPVLNLYVPRSLNAPCVSRNGKRVMGQGVAVEVFSE